MKKSKSVSVIIPSYNHGRYIEQALESVVRQTLKPAELIVIDDGSTDDSQRKIESFAKLAKKNGISYKYFFQENVGAHATLNRGLDLANSEWITILNSDDIFDVSRIELLMSYAIKKNSGCVCSKVKHIDEFGNELSDKTKRKFFCDWYTKELNEKRPNDAFHFLYHNVGITTGNLFLNRNVISKIGKFDNYQTCHDYDYFFRAMQYTNVEILPKALLDYRVHPENTIGGDRDLEAFEVIKMVSRLFRRIIVDGEKSHPSAPWSKLNRKKMGEFLKSSQQSSAILSAFGQTDVSEFIFKGN